MAYPFEDFIIGNNNEDIALATSDENRVATATLAKQARKSIHIFSHQLNPTIYGDTELLEAITQLAIRSRNSKIHILVMDTLPLIKRGHRIIETGRRISSSIQIRKVHSDFQKMHNAFFVVDEQALITRKIATRFEAILNFNHSRESRNLVKQFNEIWRRSNPEPMLKHLNI